MAPGDGSEYFAVVSLTVAGCSGSGSLFVTTIPGDFLGPGVFLGTGPTTIPKFNGGTVGFGTSTGSGAGWVCCVTCGAILVSGKGGGIGVLGDCLAAFGGSGGCDPSFMNGGGAAIPPKNTGLTVCIFVCNTAGGGGFG